MTVLPGQAGSADEGTAMLEIVLDIAPGAQLYFATAFTAITSFAQNIRDLRTAGCDIIVDDVGYSVETPFQNGSVTVVSTTNGGIVTQAVNDVTAAGRALLFLRRKLRQPGRGHVRHVGRGLRGRRRRPAGRWPAVMVHNFERRALTFDTITAGGTPIILFWSDPLGGSVE